MDITLSEGDWRHCYVGLEGTIPDQVVGTGSKSSSGGANEMPLFPVGRGAFLGRPRHNDPAEMEKLDESGGIGAFQLPLKRNTHLDLPTTKQFHLLVGFIYR